MTLAYMHDILVICMKQEAYIISQKKKTFVDPVARKYVLIIFTSNWINHVNGCSTGHTHTCMYVINQFRGRTAIELLLLYLILMSVKIILSRWRR